MSLFPWNRPAKILAIPILAVFLLGLSCAEPPRRITIIHHNDFHAANIPFDIPAGDGETITIMGIGGLKGLANTVRDTASPNLWLYAGDEYTGTPISSLTLGASQILLCQKLGLDVAVLGNHEFDYTLERACAFRDSIGVPVLGGANLLDQQGMPFALTHYDTIVGNVPMRIIGLVPPNLHWLSCHYVTGELKVIEAVEAVKKFIPQKKRLTVVLSHMGYRPDSLLAVKMPEIDLIVGGHQHKALKNPRLVGAQGRMPDSLLTGNGADRLPGTVIVQAGWRGEYLGVLSLQVKNGEIIAAAGQLLHNDGSLTLPDYEIAALAQSLEQEYTGHLNQEIARLEKPLLMQPKNRETPLGRWVTDAIRQALDADIAFYNPGGIRKTLKAGPLTQRDILELAPFNNTLVTFEMTGRELTETLKFAVSRSRLPLFASGLTVTMDRSKNTISIPRVGGNNVSMDKSYKVGTINFLVGHFEDSFGIPQGGREVIETELIDSEALMDYAEKMKVIHPPLDVRMEIID